MDAQSADCGSNHHVTCTVNGRAVGAHVPAATFLVEYLRESLGLTGTNVGCDTAQCGACTILLDGAPIKSCTILAVQAESASITTIEGLADPSGKLHPMQQAFRQHHGLQCGYCTPGMIMTAIGMLENRRTLTDAEVRRELEGNLCRCTGYQNIVRAILACAKGGR